MLVWQQETDTVTVDVSEIRQSPVEVGNLSQSLLMVL